MSIRLMSQVWDLEIPTSRKMLLLALADRANDEGECWPGQANIAAKCSMSARAVVDNVKWLRDHGLIEVEHRRVGFSRRSNRYVITLDGFVKDGGLIAKDRPHSADSAHTQSANPAHSHSANPALTHSADSAHTQSANPAHAIEEETSEKKHQQEPSGVAPGSTPRRATGKAAANPLNVATWNAYAAAYSARYGVEPLRNASTNGKVAQLVARLGAHAPAVAEFFLGSNAAFYVQRGHAVGALLADAEKLYTEWATGRRVTATAARQAEQTQTNFDNAAQALAILRARREGKGE